MDIANYIGLFLLKNHFCYIHGLGNLELKKKSAVYEEGMLQSSSYEIVLTPAGSIDDNLANFIATNEQISISKASNALRDFSTQAKADLQNGKEVVIPHIGKFVEDNGKIHFITDPKLQYTPSGIPTIKNSKQLEERQNPTTKSYTNDYNTEPSSGTTVNWGRIGVAVGILVIIAGAVIGIMYYLNHANNNNDNVQAPVTTTPAAAVQPPQTDTPKAVAPPPSAANPDSLQNYDVIVNVYDNRKRAEGRVHFMTQTLGKKANLVAKDSSTYLITMPVYCKPVDTTMVIDSLAKLYSKNKSEVHVYHASK